MAGFGGAVKLTGESEYKKALREISQNLREVGSQMKVVSSEYSANDRSTSALAARSEVLNAKLAEQKNKLSVLQAQYRAMSAQYAENTTKHQQLIDKYNDEKAKLDQIGQTLGTTSQEYKDQQKVVSGLEQEVRKSTTAQEANAKSMSQVRIQLNNTQAEINETTNDLDGLDEELDDNTKGWSSWGQTLADLRTKAISAALNGIKELGSALISLGKEAITSYADYEQLVGGVETLFKDSAPIVEGYANEAYKSAGLSANQYMETVTGFSASLLQGLGGDTKKVAEVSNQAVIDMADNANKMGTSMESIQNAYQGFAKDNYTMLDNLKLGYGGTKEEMARLINDSGVLGDTFVTTGQKGNFNEVVTFDKVIEAIHVVQDELGITGTTMKEAEQTISGSVAMMKSSWQNLLTGMADDNANFDQLINNFVTSIETVGKNLIPRIKTTITGIAKLVSGLLKELVPMLVKEIPPILTETLPILLDAVKSVIQAILEVTPTIIPIITDTLMQLVQMIIDNLPMVIDAGIQFVLALINGITEALPQLIAMLPSIIKQIFDVIMANLPAIIDAGVKLLLALIQGLSEAIPELISYLPEVIDTIVTFIMDNLPMIIDAGIQIIVAVATGIIKALPQLIGTAVKLIEKLIKYFITTLPQFLEIGVKAIFSVIQGIGQTLGQLIASAGEVVTKTINKFKELPTRIVEVGKNLIKGLWNGIDDTKNWILDKIKGFGSAVLDGIKSFFGIHSPSTVFKDQIGKNLALGIGEGFSDEMKNVTDEMQNSIPTSFDTSINASNGSTSVVGGSAYEAMVSAFKTALGDVKIVLDDEVAGSFIDKTVTKLVYN